MTEVIRQASCVSIDGRAVLIEGEPGSGKSSLALALIDRGAQLVGDDGVILVPAGERLLVRPHPNVRALLEVRNLGILRFPVVEEAQVVLVLHLDKAAPRFIDGAETVVLAGRGLPLVRLWPDSLNLAFKAELALRTYGLSRS